MMQSATNEREHFSPAVAMTIYHGTHILYQKIPEPWGQRTNLGAASVVPGHVTRKLLNLLSRWALGHLALIFPQIFYIYCINLPPARAGAEKYGEARSWKQNTKFIAARYFLRRKLRAHISRPTLGAAIIYRRAIFRWNYIRSAEREKVEACGSGRKSGARNTQRPERWEKSAAATMARWKFNEANFNIDFV